MGRPTKEEVKNRLDEIDSGSMEAEKIEVIEPKVKTRPRRKFQEFMENPMAFENYIEINPEYSYYWHDVHLIERMGMGIWERVDSDNHKIHKGISPHVDGSIRLGTAILCYAWKEDVDIRQKRIDKKTNSLLPKAVNEARTELSSIAREGGLPEPTVSITERRY